MEETMGRSLIVSFISVATTMILISILSLVLISTAAQAYHDCATAPGMDDNELSAHFRSVPADKEVVVWRGVNFEGLVHVHLQGSNGEGEAEFTIIDLDSGSIISTVVASGLQTFGVAGHSKRLEVRMKPHEKGVCFACAKNMDYRSTEDLANFFKSVNYQKCGGDLACVEKYLRRPVPGLSSPQHSSILWPAN